MPIYENEKDKENLVEQSELSQQPAKEEWLVLDENDELLDSLLKNVSQSKVENDLEECIDNDKVVYAEHTVVETDEDKKKKKEEDKLSFVGEKVQDEQADKKVENTKNDDKEAQSHVTNMSDGQLDFEEKYIKDALKDKKNRGKYIDKEDVMMISLRYEKDKANNIKIGLSPADAEKKAAAMRKAELDSLIAKAEPYNKDTIREAQFAAGKKGKALEYYHLENVKNGDGKKEPTLVTTRVGRDITKKYARDRIEKSREAAKDNHNKAKEQAKGASNDVKTISSGDAEQMSKGTVYLSVNALMFLVNKMIEKGHELSADFREAMAKRGIKFEDLDPDKKKTEEPVVENSEKDNEGLDAENGEVEETTPEEQLEGEEQEEPTQEEISEDPEKVEEPSKEDVSDEELVNAEDQAVEEDMEEDVSTALNSMDGNTNEEVEEEITSEEIEEEVVEETMGEDIEEEETVDSISLDDDKSSKSDVTKTSSLELPKNLEQPTPDVSKTESFVPASNKIDIASKGESSKTDVLNDMFGKDGGLDASTPKKITGSDIIKTAQKVADKLAEALEADDDYGR